MKRNRDIERRGEWEKGRMGEWEKEIRREWVNG